MRQKQLREFRLGDYAKEVLGAHKRPTAFEEREQFEHEERRIHNLQPCGGGVRIIRKKLGGDN